MRYPLFEFENLLDEYEEKIEWYRDFIKRYENEPLSRKEEEYMAYLRRWFEDAPCNGLPDFKTRHNWLTLPMSFNVYFNN